MEWLCLCVRGGLARGEGNGEIGDNAESYCTESFWPSSHSHPICHHNLFIRHSAGTFSEMQLLIMHVDLKWNWERGAWKRLRDIENTSASVFFYTQLALLIKSQNTVPVGGCVLFWNMKLEKVRVWIVSIVTDLRWLDNSVVSQPNSTAWDALLTVNWRRRRRSRRKSPCSHLTQNTLSSAWWPFHTQH